MAAESCCPPNSWPGVCEDSTRQLSGNIEKSGTTGLVTYNVDASGEGQSDKGVIVLYDVHG